MPVNDRFSTQHTTTSTMHVPRSQSDAGKTEKQWGLGCGGMRGPWCEEREEMKREVEMNASSPKHTTTSTMHVPRSQSDAGKTEKQWGLGCGG